MSRTVRSVRLAPALWHALDAAALAATQRGGRYLSSNALLEEIVRTRVAAGPVADAANPALERLRHAREAQRTREAAGIASQRRYLRHLSSSSRSERQRALGLAAAQVALWRRKRLASRIYLEAWERLLGAGPRAILRAFESGYEGLSPAALAANSPFHTGVPPGEAS
ncbi:MAG: hypothetical protein HY017_32180 [Betaproteobacteria bacterium]|nr:hypothetical protein [Betaproteobacteria bacterium]